MTFKDIQDEVIALRFDESRRASVKRWINARYAAIWSEADWHFKHVTDASLAVTGGSTAPTTPNELLRVDALYDDNGARLIELSPDRYRDYATNDTSSARPAYYTVIDHQILLWPKPDASYTFKLSYERRLAHVDAGSGIIGGVLVNDGDQPIWEAEYDYALVVDAALMGAQLLDDLGAPDLQAQRDTLVQAMKDDLVRQDNDIVQWGASDLSYGEWS